MIQPASRDGKINKDTVIHRADQRQHRHRLAFVCAAKSFRLILTMPNHEHGTPHPPSMLGAEIVLTPGRKACPAQFAARGIAQGDAQQFFMPQTFNNPANPEIHRKTTALEIWDDTDAKWTTSSPALARAARSPASVKSQEEEALIKAIAVEPVDSPVMTQDQGRSAVKPALIKSRASARDSSRRS